MYHPPVEVLPDLDACFQNSALTAVVALFHDSVLLLFCHAAFASEPKLVLVKALISASQHRVSDRGCWKLKALQVRASVAALNQRVSARGCWSRRWSVPLSPG